MIMKDINENKTTQPETPIVVDNLSDFPPKGDKEPKFAKSIELTVNWIDRFVLRYAWILTILAMISSQLLSSYTENFAFLAAFLWKAAGITLGAWIGDLVFVKYFCMSHKEKDICAVSDVHRLYFILGICAIFGLRF
jgi:hypothetical protein